MCAIPGVTVRGGDVLIPHHAVAVVDSLMRHAQVSPQGAAWTAQPSALPWDEAHAALHTGGEVRASFLGDYPLPHQRDGLSFAAGRTGALLHHPTGTGKTYSAIMWMLIEPGAALFVTRSSTAMQFCRQVRKYTHLEPFALRAAVHRRKRDKFASLDDYLDWCQRNGQRPVVSTGMETLPARLSALLAVRFRSVVWDESHLLKSWRRWDVVPLPELPEHGAPNHAEAMAIRNNQIALGRKAGGFVKQGDDGEDILIVPGDNRTTAAFALAKATPRRLATTATPIRDRVRDLYAQLTLIEPWSWGSWSVWSRRYCDAKPNLYNSRAMDTRGTSNLDELVGRLGTVVHGVSAHEARKNLPPMRLETVYVTRDQMDTLTEAEHKRFLKESGKAKKRGKSALLEVRIAEAAARCRTAMLERIEDHVATGHKIVVFTVRRWLAKKLLGNVKRVTRKHKGTLVVMGHGGDSQQARQAMLDQWIQHDGPAVLIGTGHAWGTSTDGMQIADAGFFLGHPYEPGELDQWIGRFPRLGRFNPMVLYFLVGEDTALERFASIVLDKMPAIVEVADSGALVGVEDALGGTADPDALASSILGKIGAG